MPYISKTARPGVRASGAENPGELNFLLTELAIDYVRGQGGVSYPAINDVMGAFAGAAQEFYRRVAAPYEDQKIDQNGDVYPAAMAPSIPPLPEF